MMGFFKKSVTFALGWIDSVLLLLMMIIDSIHPRQHYIDGTNKIEHLNINKIIWI